MDVSLSVERTDGVTNPNSSVIGACGEHFTIGTEPYTANVEVFLLYNTVMY